MKPAIEVLPDITARSLGRRIWFRGLMHIERVLINLAIRVVNEVKRIYELKKFRDRSDLPVGSSIYESRLK